MPSEGLRIRCSICDKQVGRWETREDPANCGWAIKVWCHGGQDEMFMPMLFIEQHGHQLGEGTAFATKKIALTANTGAPDA